jgi:hypothetical protein
MRLVWKREKASLIKEVCRICLPKFIWAGRYGILLGLLTGYDGLIHSWSEWSYTVSAFRNKKEKEKE